MRLKGRSANRKSTIEGLKYFKAITIEGLKYLEGIYRSEEVIEKTQVYYITYPTTQYIFLQDWTSFEVNYDSDIQGN